MAHHGRNVGSSTSRVAASAKNAVVSKRVDKRVGKLGTPGKMPEDPHVLEIARTETNRPVKAGGGGKHRGDRRDMSPTYTGNAKHAARGNTPRKDVTTRAR